MAWRRSLVLGLLGLAVLGTACRPSSEIRPAFTEEARMPEGGLSGTILFTGRGEDGNVIHRYDPQTRRVERVVRGAKAPALSPDGARLAFAVPEGEAAGIYVSSPDGGDRRAVVRGPGSFDGPAWSPDGTRIAYAHIENADGAWNLSVVPAEGGEPEPLTSSPSQDWYPTWSPDGTRIAFTSDRDGDNAIWLLDLETGEQRKIVDSEAEDREPAWSPDGTRILFSSNRDLDRWQLFVYDVEAGTDENLLRTTGMDRFPTWSTDGEIILVSVGYLAAYRADGEPFPDGADRWKLTERLATTSVWRGG